MRKSAFQLSTFVFSLLLTACGSHGTVPQAPTARGIMAFQSYNVTVGVNSPTTQPKPPGTGRTPLFANAPPDDGAPIGGESTCTYTYFGTGWANDPPSPNPGDFLISVSCSNDIDTSMVATPLPEDGDCMMYTGVQRALCLGVDVATVAGKMPAGGTCMGSPTEHEAGKTNLPSGNNDWASTVANIIALYNPSTNAVYGWAYQTENQSMWFQRNPAAASAEVDFLTAFFSKLPGISAITTALVNATTQPYQLTGTQWINIQQSAQAGGLKAHRCYTKPYSG